LPHAFQNLPSGLLREIQVEQKKMGLNETSIPIHGLHKGYALLAVIKYPEFKFQAGLF